MNRTFHRFSHLGLAFVLLTIQWGCSPPGAESGPDLELYDSAGVTIIENSDSTWTEDTRWRLETLPGFGRRPGRGTGEHPLFRVGNIVRLNDGRLVVENRGFRQLLVLDQDGIVVDSWGREGEGEGEFRNLLGLFLCGTETLVVREFQRVSFFDNQGSFIRAVRIPDEVLKPFFGQVTPGVSSDCGRLLVSTELGRWVSKSDAIGELQVLVSWISLTNGAVDTVGVFPDEERVELKEPGNPKAVFPFNLNPSWATDGDLAFWGRGDRPEIQVYDQNGTIVRVIRWQARNDGITHEDWEAYETDKARYLETSPEAEPFLVSRWSHPRPKFKPFFSGEPLGGGFYPGIRIDAEGNLWVRRHTIRSLLRDQSRDRPLRQAESWWVFNEEGRWLGTIETPGNFLIRYLGDSLIVGVSRTEADVERLVGYSVRKPEGSRGG